MKRLMIPCFLIFVLLPGCASLQAKREVIDNTLYSSSNPKIQIKISSEFKYIGEIKDTGARQADSSTRMLTHRAKWYVFVDSDASRVNRMVSIRIERTETHYVSDLFSYVKSSYERGTCELGGRNFQYCSRLIYPGMDHPVTRFVSDQGYVIPTCVLSKSFKKVYGAKGNILVDIKYLEDPSNLPYDCRAWKPDYPLLEGQKAYLEQFNKNCESSFAVLQYVAGKEVYTTAENYQRDVKKSQISEQSDHNNKKYINIQSRQPIYEFGEIKFYAIEGDILDILLEKTCRSGTGICWKVKCRRTGKIGYVSAAMMEKRHQVIEE
jgi:hypothetical protein